MPHLRIVFLILIVATVTWAAGTPVETAQEFEKAVAGAASWNDIKPQLSADTLTDLNKLSSAQQIKALGLFKMLMATAAPNPTATAEVKGSRATVKLRVETTEAGAKMTETRTYQLVLEGGAWKVDFREPLKSVK